MSATRPFPLPINEAARAEAVEVLSSSAARNEPLFDEVAEIAREAFGAPVGLVTLIDSDTSQFLARTGTDIPGVQREFSLCTHTFVTQSPLVIPDALADPRWCSQPVVTNAPNVRFYAGVPVVLSAGFAVGTVCVVDFAPRHEPTPEQMRLLERLARIVARAHEIPIEPDAAAAAALQAAQRRAQDEFLALVSHELRTPLSGIAGVADLLEPGEAADPDLVEALRHSGSHLGAIVENVLTFSRLRSGELTLNEEARDLDGLLDGVARAFAALGRSRGKVIERGGGSVGRALVDPAKFELAVACLLSNVVMHGGREAEVSAWRRPGGGIVVEVTDDGRGIDPAAQEAAFRAFSHLGALNTRSADGMGLGLPLTRRLIDLHGGEVCLVRAGDRFLARVELPPHRSLQS